MGGRHFIENPNDVHGSMELNLYTQEVDRDQQIYVLMVGYKNGLKNLN